MSVSGSPERISIPNGSDRMSDTERRLLPHDLGGALKYASNEDLKELRDAVSQEMKRRNLPPKKTPGGPVKKKIAKADHPVDDLTRSQINLVRASIQAGVKPAVLARQFGISLASIRTVLAQK